MISVLILSIIGLASSKVVRDFNKKRIKTTVFLTYQGFFFLFAIGAINLIDIQEVSGLLGFEIPSNFILLTLSIVGLWSNYLMQLKIRTLEVQNTKLARYIAINGGNLDK
jgi:hypothetical protein